MDEIGKCIREARKSSGMTQDQLAAATGLSKSFISEIENDARNASSRNLLNIANALDASVEYLLRGIAPAVAAGDGAILIPPQLAAAAERLGLSFAQTLDLLQTQRSIVARRGAAARKELTLQDWIDLHRTIKKVFG